MELQSEGSGLGEHKKITLYIEYISTTADNDAYSRSKSTCSTDSDAWINQSDTPLIPYNRHVFPTLLQIQTATV